MSKKFVLLIVLGLIGSVEIVNASNVTTVLDPNSRAGRIDFDSDGLYLDDDLNFLNYVWGSRNSNNEYIGTMHEYTASGFFSSGEARVVYEFDMSDFLSNPASIQNVTLDINYSGGGYANNDSFPSVDLYGFMGNGNAYEETDFSGGTYLMNLTPASVHSSDYFHSIDLTNFVSNLTTDYLGISLRVTSYNPNSSSIVALTPSIIVTTVPAPAAIWLFVSGLLGVVGIKKSVKSV